MMISWRGALLGDADCPISLIGWLYIFTLEILPEIYAMMRYITARKANFADGIINVTQDMSLFKEESCRIYCCI